MIDIKPPNIIKSISIPIFSFLLFSLVACRTQKTIAEDKKSFEINPKLIFLNYTVSKKENGEKNITFINKIVTDGRLKKINTSYLKNANVGDLTCTQLDKNATILQSILIKNPLSKVIEFVNDSLTFEKRKVELKNSELALRLQLHNKTKSIIISEIIDSLQNSKVLIKTALN